MFGVPPVRREDVLGAFGHTRDTIERSTGDREKINWSQVADITTKADEFVDPHNEPRFRRICHVREHD
jgi:hypothetical protein